MLFDPVNYAEDDIDIHVERILKLTENLKGKMGPGTNCDHSNERPGPNDPKDVQLLQKLSRESLVLLKNEANVLPLAEAGRY